jgi:hypothetical protein
MTLYRKFGTDSNVETAGVVLDYGEGVKIRIARAGGANKAYLKALERLSRKYRRQIQLDILDEETAREVFRAIYAETIVIGWEGVTGREGKPIEFSRENCIKLFEDLPDLFADIQAQAGNAALFRAEIAENDGKN